MICFSEAKKYFHIGAHNHRMQNQKSVSDVDCNPRAWNNLTKLCAEMRSRTKQQAGRQLNNTLTYSCTTSCNQLPPPHSWYLLFFGEFIWHRHILTNVNHLHTNGNQSNLISYCAQIYINCQQQKQILIPSIWRCNGKLYNEERNFIMRKENFIVSTVICLILKMLPFCNIMP